jgi:D-lyxose ketol-isomerase
MEEMSITVTPDLDDIESIRVLEARPVTKKWGREVLIASNEEAGYTGKLLTVLPGGSKRQYCCSIHYHRIKTETFYIDQGELWLELFEVRMPAGFTEISNLLPRHLGASRVYRLGPGEAIEITTFLPHRFWAASKVPVQFYEFSTFDTPEDSYRLVESCLLSHMNDWKKVS